MSEVRNVIEKTPDIGNTNWTNLEKALGCLAENVAEFSIGAVSLDDYRPVEEKIKIMRETLKRLNARLLMLKARRDIKFRSEAPEGSVEDIPEKLEENIANVIINNSAIKQCLHSNAIEDVLSNGKHKDMQEKMYEALKKLFVLNDTILSTQRSFEIVYKKQLDLKIQCQKEILDYHSFLKEQAELREQKLQESNPTALRNKEKLMKKIKQINIMKKLITNLIATSAEMLRKEPFFVEMLEKHAELINEETIIKLAENIT